MLTLILINSTSFDTNYQREWFSANWTYSLYASIMYLTIIYYGKKIMNNQMGFSLRKILFVWNSILALFSLMGTWNLLPELIDSVSSMGFYNSICLNSFIENPKIEFWMWLFTWSKIVELGDTMFILMKKQKLIFLHWIHHLLTLNYCFFVYSLAPGTSRWGITINYLIHSIMYSYYALKSVRFPVHDLVSQLITNLQIIQMIIGFFVGLTAVHQAIQSPNRCSNTLSSSLATTGITLFYLILFIKFYFNRYFKTKLN